MYFPALTLSVQLSRSDVWIIQTALCLSAVAIKHANKQQQNLQSKNHEQKLAVGVEAIILLKKRSDSTSRYVLNSTSYSSIFHFIYSDASVLCGWRLNKDSQRVFFL